MRPLLIAAALLSYIAPPARASGETAEQCAEWAAKRRKGSIGDQRTLIKYGEYEGLIRGVPFLHGKLGEDASVWPDFIYISEKEANEQGLTGELAIAVSYPPNYGPNNTNRYMVVLTERVYDVTCNDGQFLWVIAHELAHQVTRNMHEGQMNHLDWMKNRKQELFKEWYGGATKWIHDSLIKDDPWIRDWWKSHLNDANPSPLNDKKYFGKVWDFFQKQRAHMLSEDAQAQEDEADEDGIQYVSTYVGKRGGKFTRQDVGDVLMKMSKIEKKIHVQTAPYKTHRDADKRALQALDNASLSKILNRSERRNQKQSKEYVAP